MKNFMKLFVVAGLLMGSAIFANAQTARGLYIAYNANESAKPPKKPKKVKKPVKQPPGKPPIIVNTGATPSATGLPGTKITIELNRNGRLSFVKPTYRFRSGDKIRLRLATNFEGYISLLNVGSTGEVQFLYPYEGANNRVMPSKDIQIPGSDAWIVFDDKPGTENLTVIMSKEPLGESDDDYRDIRQSNSRDLLIEYANDGVYAVSQEDKISKPVGFTLRLKHGK
jgi:hypothetical protein